MSGSPWVFKRNERGIQTLIFVANTHITVAGRVHEDQSATIGSQEKRAAILFYCPFDAGFSVNSSYNRVFNVEGSEFRARKKFDLCFSEFSHKGIIRKTKAVLQFP